jgi:predicted nucleic acid-binding protein
VLILDATVIINFGAMEALPLIHQVLARPILVADEAAAEIRHPPSAVEQLHQAIADGWLRRHRLATVEEFTWLAELQQRAPSAGAGEIASIAACLANGWSFATDDRRARILAATAAEGRKVEVTGTVGILVSAVRLRVIDRSEAERLYQGMIAAGCHGPVRRLSEALDR